MITRCHWPALDGTIINHDVDHGPANMTHLSVVGDRPTADRVGNMLPPDLRGTWAIHEATVDDRDRRNHRSTLSHPRRSKPAA